MGHVFQMEQHVKALRQGRAEQAQRPEADQQGWSTETKLTELACVSSNLLGKAALPPSAVAEAHRKAGVAKSHHCCPYSTERGEGT